MNRTSLRYKLYKYSLEENLSQQQRDVILSESFMSKIGAFLGLPGEVGGAIANAFKNAEVASLSKSLKKNFTDLKNVAAKLDNGDKIVAGILNSLLGEAGFEPSNIAQTDLSKIDSKSEGGKGDATMKPGTPIDSGNEEVAKKQIAAMAASVAGKDAQKAAENAADMKADTVAATLANVTAALAKQDPKSTRQVVDYLIQNKHLKFEGRRVNTIFDLKNITSVMNEAYKENLVLEKWSKLSGLELLDENGDNPPATQKSPASETKEKSKDPAQPKKTDEVPKEAGKFSSLIDKIVGKIKGVKKPQIAAILLALDGKPNIAVS